MKFYITFVKTSNHLLSLLTFASFEVVLFVWLFPLPSEWNLNFKRERFTSNEVTEELSYLKMIGTIVYHLTRNLSEEDVIK